MQKLPAYCFVSFHVQHIYIFATLLVSNATFLYVQAARALANLAAHGDNNDNNAAVGQEAGALEALVQLTGSHNEGVRYI